MARLVGPACKVYMEPTLVGDGEEDAWQGSDVFLMEIKVADEVLKWPEDGRNMIWYPHIGKSPEEDSRKTRFVAERHELMLGNPNPAVQRLSSLLSTAGVPCVFHPQFSPLLHSEACSLADMRRHVIPIAVSIHPGFVSNTVLTVDEIVMETRRHMLMEKAIKNKKAASDSIEALIEKVKIEKEEMENLEQYCMIKRFGRTRTNKIFQCCIAPMFPTGIEV